MKKNVFIRKNRTFFTIVLTGATVLAALSILNVSAQAETEILPIDAVSPEYRAIWNDEVNREIDERIEKYRKADAEFTLEKAGGRSVTVTQKTHEFEFGAQIFNFNQLGSDELNAKYQALFGADRFFNSATLPFYWAGMEPTEGKVRFVPEFRDSAEYWNQVAEPQKEPHWRRPCPEPIIEFCEKNGVSMHGHPIIYCRVLPPWMKTTPEYKETMTRKFREHAHQLIDQYQGRLGSWDVVNESVEPTPGKSRYKLTPDDYTFTTWQIAQTEFPSHVKLAINDSWRSVYPPFIKGLMERGAKIDIVGLQMHIFGSKPILDIAAGKDCITNGTSWKPKDVESYLRELDQLGRPIHLSEITIPAPGTDAQAEAIQAQVTRDMYRLWFSWPSIYRITWWNVVDDCGYRNEPTKSGLFTRQMEPKPVFWAMDQLINHEWKTNLTLQADSDGKIAFRGFRGKYTLTWKDGDGNEHVQEVTVH